MNSILPQPIVLDEGDAKRLRNLNDKMQAINTFIKSVSEQGERRIAEVTEEGRSIWLDLGKKHNLDLQRVHYTLGADGTSIEPVSMRLQG